MAYDAQRCSALLSVNVNCSDWLICRVRHLQLAPDIVLSICQNMVEYSWPGQNGARSCPQSLSSDILAFGHHIMTTRSYWIRDIAVEAQLHFVSRGCFFLSTHVVIDLTRNIFGSRLIIGNSVTSFLWIDTENVNAFATRLLAVSHLLGRVQASFRLNFLVTCNPVAVCTMWNVRYHLNGQERLKPHSPNP